VKAFLLALMLTGACAMKPEHRDWMPEILQRLRAAAGD